MFGTEIFAVCQQRENSLCVLTITAGMEGENVWQDQEQQLQIKNLRE